MNPALQVHCYIGPLACTPHTHPCSGKSDESSLANKLLLAHPELGVSGVRFDARRTAVEVMVAVPTAFVKAALEKVLVQVSSVGVAVWQWRRR